MTHCVTYNEVKFDSARDFVNYLRPSNSVWLNPLGINEYIYRGTWNSDWELLPPAWRNVTPKFFQNVGRYLKTFESVAHGRLCRGESFGHLQTVYGTYQNKNDCLAHALHFATELECIWRFAALADEVGLNVPERHKTLSGYGFLRGFGTATSTHPNSAAAALAQHHGVPTRLLDWTFDPLKAAYFAVRPEGRQGSSDRLAVWALNKTKVQCQATPCPAGVVVFELPRHDHTFLHAQAGLFTYIENADHFYLHNEGRWPLLSEVVPPVANAIPDHERPLVKCILEIKAANQLRDILWQERISTSRLMPTFDHVAQDVMMWAEAYPDHPMNEKQL